MGRRLRLQTSFDVAHYPVRRQSPGQISRSNIRAKWAAHRSWRRRRLIAISAVEAANAGTSSLVSDDGCLAKFISALVRSGIPLVREKGSE